MGWNAQDIEKLRKQNNGQKSTQGTGQSAAPKSTTAPAPARSSGSTGWSAEKIDALRTGRGTKPAAKSTDAWVNRSAGTSVRSTEQKAGTQSAGKSNKNPTSGSLSAQAKASRSAGSAAAKSSGKASGRAAGTTGGTAGTNALKGSIVVPFTAALLRSRGKSDTSIANALQKEGYTTSEIAKILQQMNQ